MDQTPLKPAPGAIANPDTVRQIFPWAAICFGVLTGIGMAWYYYKNLRK